MDRVYFRTLFDYTFWMDRKVWDCVVTLSKAQFTAPLDYSVGSICEQCVHMMAVEYWWPYFLQHGQMPDLTIFKETDFSVFENLRAQWDKVERDVCAYVDSLTGEELQREVKPPHWDETDRPVRVWEALLQVANHSTDHRAQILAGLHRLGAKTIGQDYLLYADAHPLPPIA